MGKRDSIVSGTLAGVAVTMLALVLLASGVVGGFEAAMICSNDINGKYRYRTVLVSHTDRYSNRLVRYSKKQGKG